MKYIEKSNRHLFQELSMIYSFIKNHETVYLIEKKCKILGIRLRSHYDWKSNFVFDRKQRVVLIKEEIGTVYFAKKQRYGSPRITVELQTKGIKISRTTVVKYMRDMGLRSKLGRKFKDNDKFKAFAQDYGKSSE